MPLSQAEATDRAEAEVQAYCGWHVAPTEEHSLTLDGTGSSTLLLPSLYVIAMTIVEDGVDVDPGDYEWSQAGVVRRIANTTNGGGWSCARWTSHLRGLAVTLNHGYPQWPLDVQTVMDRLTARLIDSSAGAGPFTQVGQVQYAIGADGLPVGGSLTELDRAVLARYKLPPRP